MHLFYIIDKLKMMFAVEAETAAKAVDRFNDSHPVLHHVVIAVERCPVCGGRPRPQLPEWMNYERNIHMKVCAHTVEVKI